MDKNDVPITDRRRVVSYVHRTQLFRSALRDMRRSTQKSHPGRSRRSARSRGPFQGDELQTNTRPLRHLRPSIAGTVWLPQWGEMEISQGDARSIGVDLHQGRWVALYDLQQPQQPVGLLCRPAQQHDLRRRPERALPSGHQRRRSRDAADPPHPVVPIQRASQVTEPVQLVH